MTLNRLMRRPAVRESTQQCLKRLLLRSGCIWMVLSACAVAALAEPKTEPVHRESILAQTSDYERGLEISGAFLEDSGITAYLNGILTTLCANELNPGQYRVRVLKSSSFNAFATPHGTIYLCTPLLARIENEAQCAALLSHELSHPVADHAPRNLINVKKHALANAQLRIGLDFFLGSLSGPIGSAAIRSAITGYSRELEREADSLGLIRMRKAGYAPKEFRNLFMILREYLETESVKQPFFFATHPAITERIDNYHALMGKDTAFAASGTINEEGFTKMIANVLLCEGSLATASGKPDLAEELLSRIIHADPCNSSALAALAENQCLKPHTTIDAIALDWYRQALQCNESYPEALRRLGCYYYKWNQRDSACYYLAAYKAQSPDSPYLPLIETYLSQCRH